MRSTPPTEISRSDTPAGAPRGIRRLAQLPFSPEAPAARRVSCCPSLPAEREIRIENGTLHSNHGAVQIRWELSCPDPRQTARRWTPCQPARASRDRDAPLVALAARRQARAPLVPSSRRAARLN